MPQTPTILFQPPNHIVAAIALAVTGIDRSIRVPFVVEGGSHMLLESHGLPYLTLPSTDTLYRSPCWASWAHGDLSRAMISLSKTMIRELGAEVVVFDCFPSVPFAIAAVESGTAIVLCMRRMKSLGDYLKMIAYLIPHLQLVLVAEEADVVEMPKALANRVEYVGRVVRQMSDRRAVPTSVAPGKHVIITGGGGGYPGTVEFYNLALKAFADVHARFRDVTGLLVTGPLFNDWLQLELVDGIRVLPFSSDLAVDLACADAIVCQAGYNTMEEVAAAGRPTICIPARRDFDDQQERALRLAATNSHIRVFTGSTVVELAELIVSCMRRPRERVEIRMCDGAQRAARRLCELVNARVVEAV